MDKTPVLGDILVENFIKSDKKVILSIFDKNDPLMTPNRSKKTLKMKNYQI